MVKLSQMWFLGLLRQRGVALIGAVGGIAVAVALLATLAGFFAATEAKMTSQAVADVAIDWQIQLNAAANQDSAISELQKSPGAPKLAEVGYADSPGFEATTGNTTQTT